MALEEILGVGYSYLHKLSLYAWLVAKILIMCYNAFHYYIHLLFGLLYIVFSAQAYLIVDYTIVLFFVNVT